MKKINIFITIFISCLLGCRKEFLEMKSDKALLVPTTLNELQSLLDNSYGVFNNRSSFFTLISSDDIILSEDGFKGAGSMLGNCYIWSDDLYEGSLNVTDWNLPYEQVFYANVILDGLKKLEIASVDSTKFNSIKGAALFFRAYAFYQLAQQFAQPYNSSTSNQLLGIPIRLESDVNIKSKRGTLQETYDQILNDLIEASTILPINVAFKTRPSKEAAFGMLARVYLGMGFYKEARLYADECLSLGGKLIDYNEYDLEATYPFPPFDKLVEEVVFYSLMTSNSVLNSSQTFVDSLLYVSYDEMDLRRELFFRKRENNNVTFKGSYGNADIFSGIGLDEIYLIRSECNIRLGNVSKGIDDLNVLLEKRWKKGQFIPIATESENEALIIMLRERRKELVYRNLRWQDLRRLTQEEEFAITIERSINGENYYLKPQSLKYTFPIPEYEISSSAIEQNDRN